MPFEQQCCDCSQSYSDMVTTCVLGGDFDYLWSAYPDLNLEPDVEDFMDKVITYMHMANKIREIEEYARGLESQQQEKGEAQRYRPLALQILLSVCRPWYETLACCMHPVLLRNVMCCWCRAGLLSIVPLGGVSLAACL